MDDAIKHVCPRRSELFFGPFETDAAEMSDTWKPLPSTNEGSDQLFCSFCGSMNPDDLFKAIDKGDEIGPTDKNYKIYVGYNPTCKFYLSHLSPSQQLKFVELVNSKKMNIGNPGHFYVLPFFMRRAANG